jgi:16S rRNA (uracil1498-N3)-methyltransferase
MQRHRFYAPPELIAAASVTLAADEAHHLARVLRLAPGARVWVFDGAGREYECEVTRVGKNEVLLKIVAQVTAAVESPLRIELAQGLAKGDKFDWIVQKATELGVTRIVPLTTTYSEMRRSEEHATGKVKRWQRIALEALKQCGRCQLVEIAEPMDWPTYCERATGDLKLFFSERGGRRLSQIAQEAVSPISRLSLAIGPEGGWSEREIDLAREKEFIPIHLGARILRTETAAIAAIALAQHLFGDLR